MVGAPSAERRRSQHPDYPSTILLSHTDLVVNAKELVTQEMSNGGVS
jgi:hypothetical protein